MDFTPLMHYLIELQFNNNRDWFKLHEKRYKNLRAQFLDFVEELILKVKEIDPLVDVQTAKETVFRINRDVRFSKNKEPYKNNMGSYICPGGKKSPYVGYYLHIEPDNCFLGGGAYRPEAPQLKAIRTAIYKNPKLYKELVSDTQFTQTFGTVQGDRLKLAPKGFDKNFPDIELLKNKHYFVFAPISEEQLSSLSLDFLQERFKALKPFNSFLNNAIAAGVNSAE